MADQEQKQGRSWADLMNSTPTIGGRMNTIAFMMDFLKDPEDALIDWNAPSDVFNAYEDQHYTQLIQHVAKQTGGSVEQIADKNKRTEEQQRALLEASAGVTTKRLYAYLDSVYMQARLIIGELQGELDQRGVMAVTYFFAMRPDLNPRDTGDLSTDAITDLKATYKRLDAFIQRHYPDADLEGDAEAVTAIITAFAEADNPAGIAPLQLHQLQKVTSYQMNKSKPFNMLGMAIPKGQADGQLKITMSPDRKTKTDVVTYLSLTYQGDDNLLMKGRKVITGFDKAVYNAVSTLYAAGNKAVSPQDIFRTMNGNTNKRPSAAQVERITNSIRKLMYTALYMDMTQELQRQRMTFNDERIVNGKVETQMLQAAIGKARTENGREITVFRLAAEPILYTYCKAKKQIITVPIALLDTSEAASNTESVTAIREYLIQQIENIKTGNRNNSTIRYDTLYKETDTETPTARKDEKRMRDQIKAVLEIWKARGYINGYRDAKTGAKITGIIIDVNREK